MDLNSIAINRMRQIRIDKGISQAYMARKLGFESSQRYANIEYGTNRLTAEVAKKAADILEVDMNVFFDQKLNVMNK